MKLGYFLEPKAPNSNYRVIMPMLALERRGHTVVWASKLTEDAPLRALSQCDLVHCFRRPDRTADLRKLSAHGVAVSFDNDDDLRMIDASARSTGGGKRVAQAPKHARNFAEMLKIARFADLTTTPSDVLAETYRSSGATNVRVIENYLDHRSMPGYGSRTKHSGLVVGWVAGREHALDLPHLSITDALSRLLEIHQDLRVVTVGTQLALSSPRYEFHSLIPFEDVVRFCSGFDVGIAPLADTRFNRARSTVKLKEYAAGGTPWLASAVGPYVGLGKREGGRVVEDEDRWLGELDTLIGGAFKRKLLSRNALKWAKRQTIDGNASLWEDAFEDAIERARQRHREPRAVAASH